MDNDQAQAKAAEWHGQAGGKLVPQLTENELAGLVNEAVQAASKRLLVALDCMDRGGPPGGFQGWQNGLGEDVGDEVEAARAELAALTGHIAAVEVEETEPT